MHILLNRCQGNQLGTVTTEKVLYWLTMLRIVNSNTRRFVAIHLQSLPQLSCTKRSTATLNEGPDSGIPSTVENDPALELTRRMLNFRAKHPHESRFRMLLPISHVFWEYASVWIGLYACVSSASILSFMTASQLYGIDLRALMDSWGHPIDDIQPYVGDGFLLSYHCHTKFTTHRLIGASLAAPVVYKLLDFFNLRDRELLLHGRVS